MESTVKTILAVDDEEHILELIRYNVVNAGYRVITAESGEEALEQLDEQQISLVLLDLMLPGIDGIEVLRLIRSNSQMKNLPVIILTAKSDEISKVVGLEVGADDYLAKPFGIHELLARIKAVLRRAERPMQREQEDIINVDRITINKTKRVVIRDEKPVDLTFKEFELLYLMAKNRGIVFSREYLIERVWGYDYLGETRTVDVHIRSLRKNLESDPNNPQYIKTIRGVGYKFGE